METVESNPSASQVCTRKHAHAHMHTHVCNVQYMLNITVDGFVFSDPVAVQAVSDGSDSPSWISVAKKKQMIYKENSLEEITVKKVACVCVCVLCVYVSIYPVVCCLLDVHIILPN